MNWLRLVLLGLSVSVASASCADGKPCDSTMELEGNYCVPTADGMGGGPGGAPAGPVEASEDFGAPCTEDAECGPDAPTCAMAPGADEGVCSVLGCDSQPEQVICPIGWSCLGFGDVCVED